MKIANKRKRILQQLRTDNLYKFATPELNVLYLVNRKPINVNQWFGYSVDDDITHTYISFVVFVRENQYRIHFQFIHRVNNRRNVSEHIYEKVATQNDFAFFVHLLYKASLINYEEI